MLLLWGGTLDKRLCIKLLQRSPRTCRKTLKWPGSTWNKIRDAVWRGNFTINKVSFARVPEMTYIMAQTEQLLGSLQLDESNWLDRFPCQVTVDEVCQGHVIKHKVIVNDVPMKALHDTGTSMSCMAKRFFDTLPMKPKLMPFNKYIAGMGRDTLGPVGECFIHLQIGGRVFQDRVVVRDNVRYILGPSVTQVIPVWYWLPDQG